MISARELRIGNLFYPIERKDGIDIPQEIPFVVAEIFPFAVRAYSFGKQLTQVEDWELTSFPTHKISPIQITEDLLLNFGWIWNENLNMFTKNWGRNGAEFMRVAHEYGKYHYGFQLGSSKYKIISKAHQLQNLYSDLTEEELELKTEKV